jgi:hypothetical protein
MNSVVEYTPKPGTHAESVNAYLLSKGWVSATAIADALDLRPISYVHAALAGAIKAGFVRKRLVDGRTEFGLASEVDALDAEEPRRKVIDAATAPKPATPAFTELYFHGGQRASEALAVDADDDLVEQLERVVESPAAPPPFPDDNSSVVNLRADTVGINVDLPRYRVQELPAKSRLVALKVSPEPRPFACGLFSDGRLVLELETGVEITLSRDNTEHLCRFLDRLNEIQPAA